MKNDIFSSISRSAIRCSSILLIGAGIILPDTAWGKDNTVMLAEQFEKNLIILCDDLLAIQEADSTSPFFGSLYCQSCNDHHSRASESVLPFSVAYIKSGDRKYLQAAIRTADWLIRQQQDSGAWVETPSEWTGTTTDQLLALSATYPLLKNHLSERQSQRWMHAIKKGADWLVRNMNHDFATINYCATSTASLMTSFEIIGDSAYVIKARELADIVVSKFDEDYFLTGEGNRIRGTKYGIDLGYNLDMSLWGLGLYSKLSGDSRAGNEVRESLKRAVNFVYPDGSIDNSWGVRSNKLMPYGSFTADGCQLLFSMYAADDGAYRTAAIENMNCFMRLRKNGLLTYGQNYSAMFNTPPCIYPTYCRAKSLALAILFGEHSAGPAKKLPSQQTGWAKYYKTLDVVHVRTKKFMATVTAYRYKDIRRGADFKYMFRPSGGSITNLWVDGYGSLQASSQTEYHRWETNFPDAPNALSITPRIEFTDTNAYYTNLYEFDGHIELKKTGKGYEVETIGELKDRNRWEGGVAYVLTNIIGDNSIEKRIKLRFHGQKPVISIIEPFIQNTNTVFQKLDDQTVRITDGKREFVFEVLDKRFKVQLGTNAERYRQPFPSLQGFPITIDVHPDKNTIVEEVRYRISIRK